MGFMDSLFGRSKPIQAKRESLFDILTAYIAMSTRFDLAPAGSAGLCFRPAASSFFESLDKEVRELLKVSAKETGTLIEVKDDKFGYRWVVLHDRDFEDLVATIHMVTDLVAEQGFSDRLLAAAFRFDLGRDKKPVYWVYNFKRGTFYPFMPIPGKQQRENSEELRLASVLEKEMKVEKQVEQWYALWDLPV